MRKDKAKMRVILLTHGHCESALARLLALECVSIVGVFVETDILRRYRPTEALKRSIKYDGLATTFSRYARKLMGLGNSYDAEMIVTEESRERLREMAEAHSVPVHFVNSFHTADTCSLIRQVSPDLGIIYGTNIIRESVFKIPRLGSINLHQGLAPLYRGGPPIFWELYNGEREIGITVHFVEAKVDSGQIILQETVPLVYDYAYALDYDRFISGFGESLHKRCASLLAESVRLIAEGTASPISQDPLFGKRYRLPTKTQKDELRRRLRQRRVEYGQVDLNRGFEIYPEGQRIDEASNV
ncbi:MAG: methionyl-tRNA formyltransferase [Blastocatellia bacterium]|jgi:folate-dependent phosphoribosylglycinamide formyltransferase PurN|nr:methionyl-tRNA formyltransferase [Blastocatellia bacterium]